MKVALVHEWLTSYAGSEKCLHALKEVFPEAPIYTTVYDQNKLPEEFKSFDIKTSFIQSLPWGVSKYQSYYPLMPSAFENFDFEEYDMVISSSHCCAKGIITRPETFHLSYIYTPVRYLWSHYQEYLKPYKGIKKFLASQVGSYMRVWDKVASERPDVLVADSIHVSKRIEKFYRRPSKVIYPPVTLANFSLAEKPTRDFYLMVGRLVNYKRFDLAIQVFNNLGLPLKIVGVGPEYKKLKALAKSNIQFLGYLSDKEIAPLYANCKAFVFPGEEDFGITPLEAQASGSPVIAYGKGGALETIKEYETGIFFREQTVLALEETLKAFERRSFSPNKIRESVLKFDVKNFKKNFADLIHTEYSTFKNKI